MISKWRWLFDQITHLLWLRASLFAVIGVVTALIGVTAESYVPMSVPDLIGADAVGTVLNVLASSMLAVTTFSLGVMLSAYSAATNNVTPRATKLLMQDTTTQNVLSTFIGSFLFSLVGIVTLTIDGYGQRGRLVLFVVTVGVILVVITALLRWIDHLSRLGRVGETTQRVEDVATEAILRRNEQPCLGGRRLDDSVTIPSGAVVLTAASTGYVQHIDSAAIETLAEEHDTRVYLMVLPGAYVVAGNEIARVCLPTDLEDAAAEGDGSGSEGKNDEKEDGDSQDDKKTKRDQTLDELREGVRGALSVGAERTYDQDPRFGIVVLAEIASRALSEAINDSGTAIDVISRLVRVMSIWTKEPENTEEDGETPEVKCPHLYVRPLHYQDLFEDGFAIIARDGADRIEIQLRLQKALSNLSQIGPKEFRDAARLQARLCLEQAEFGLRFEREKERVRQAASFEVPMP
ncbi:DUF2254 domain-containing protein [Devosia sp.]|uniref:DUF2254 domain-containing protein n=1 Tax=Devosia sp. TaxID=1871048 RepID=UPI003A911C81